MIMHSQNEGRCSPSFHSVVEMCPVGRVRFLHDPSHMFCCSVHSHEIHSSLHLASLDSTYSLLYSCLLTHCQWIVDKLEQMLGSFAPATDSSPYTKKFPEEESPSGMLARSGTYHVRSRVIDDDGQIYIGALCLFIFIFIFIFGLMR